MIAVEGRKLIGSRIREARLNLGISQAQVASVFSIHPGSVANWESGKNVPTVEHIIQLSLYLDVDVNFLLGFFSTECDAPKDENGISQFVYY